MKTSFDKFFDKQIENLKFLKGYIKARKQLEIDKSKMKLRFDKGWYIVEGQHLFKSHKSAIAFICAELNGDPTDYTIDIVDVIVDGQDEYERAWIIDIKSQCHEFCEYIKNEM